MWRGSRNSSEEIFILIFQEYQVNDVSTQTAADQVLDKITKFFKECLGTNHQKTLRIF